MTSAPSPGGPPLPEPRRPPERAGPGLTAGAVYKEHTHTHTHTNTHTHTHYSQTYPVDFQWYFPKESINFHFPQFSEILSKGSLGAAQGRMWVPGMLAHFADMVG